MTAQVLETLPLMWETWIEFWIFWLGPGLALAIVDIWGDEGGRGGAVAGRSLSLLLCLSNKLKTKQKQAKHKVSQF